MSGVTSNTTRRIRKLASDPASGHEGDIYFNTVSDNLRTHDGSSWSDVGGGISNSAGAHVIPKSDGENLVASTITDDGAGTVTIAPVSGDPAGTQLIVDDINAAVSITGAVEASGGVSAGGDLTAGGKFTVGAEKFQVNPSGFVSYYKDLTTAGNGVASIHCSHTLTDLTDSIGFTLQIDGNNSAPAGLYRISYYLDVTTAGSGGTVLATFSWNDGVTNRSSSSSTINLNGNNLASGTVLARSNGATVIGYTTTVAGATGSPQYALYVTVERLQ